MALSQNSYTFPVGDLHSPVISQEYDLPIVVGQWFGVLGETHLVDERKGRNLIVQGVMMGYSSAANLNTALQVLAQKVGKLTGTLTISGNVNVNYGSCTFRAVEKAGAGEFLDGSGVHGWCCPIKLVWRQRY